MRILQKQENGSISDMKEKKSADQLPAVNRKKKH